MQAAAHSPVLRVKEAWLEAKSLLTQHQSVQLTVHDAAESTFGAQPWRIILWGKDDGVLQQSAVHIRCCQVYAFQAGMPAGVQRG